MEYILIGLLFLWVLVLTLKVNGLVSKAINYNKQAMDYVDSLELVVEDIIAENNLKIDKALEDIRSIKSDLDLLYSEQPKQIKIEKPKPIPVIPNKIELATNLPVTKHGIIVGNNGSGKSNVLMLLVMEKIKAGHQVHILDSKQELEQIFSEQAEIASIEEAQTKFKEMVDIAKERQDLFLEVSKEYKKPIRDIDEYRKVTGLDLPDISLIVEELILLKEYGVDEGELIKALVAGRSAGVWITVVSQYLNNTILSLKGTVNFMWRVFLGTYNQYAFRALFGEVDKENKDKAKAFIGDPGKGAVLVGNKFTTYSFPELTDDYLEDWINGI